MTREPGKLPIRALFSLIIMFLFQVQGCSQGSKALIMADPYGAEAFPAMKPAAFAAAASLGVSLEWVDLPPQAEVPVFQGLLVPGSRYDAVFLPDLYEPEVGDSVKEAADVLVFCGYGNPDDPGPSLGWSRREALRAMVSSVVREEDLLMRSKPILLAAVFGPEGTYTEESDLLLSLWPERLGKDRLWIYRVANTLDRGLALQAASVLLSQNVDMAYVDAGRMTPEIFRSLAGAGVRTGLPDWTSQGLSHPKVRFSLDRDWDAFWKAGLGGIKNRKWEKISIPFRLSENFSEETTLLRSFHIR